MHYSNPSPTTGITFMINMTEASAASVYKFSAP
jgi:hypothetical protein